MKFQIIHSGFCGLLCFIFSFWSLHATAAPLFSETIPSGALRLYPDHKQPGLYYYTPGRLVLSYTREGRPEISFLEIATEGKHLFGRFGRHFNRSILAMRVHRESPERTAVLAAEKDLLRRGRIVSEMRPLPLKHIDARFDYQGVKNEEEPKKESFKAHVAADDNNSNHGELWTSRFFVVVMQGADANLFKSLLNSGPFASTISYTYWSYGIVSSPENEDVLANSHSEAADPAGSPDVESLSDPIELKPFPVLIDAIPIRVDTKRWDDIVTSLHLDEEMPFPPGYPLLEVYCFDFRMGVAKYIKRIVEIKADGVGGQPILTRVRFSADNSDITLGRVRFPFAVRTDQPINYRTIDYMTDGEKLTGDWIEMESGNAMIDVSTYKKANQ